MELANIYSVLKVFKEDDPKPKFSIINEPHQADGMPPREFYVPDIKTKNISDFYELPIGLWQGEKIANLRNQESITKSETLEIDWVTPLDVKAFRQGKIKINPIVACCITITKDNQILIPFRGGELSEEGRKLYARGKVGLIPAGGITWKQKYLKDPITDAITQEFTEEIGHFNYEFLGLIGIIESISDLPGIKFISVVKVNATLRQIQETNVNSINLRNILNKKGIKSEEIEEELKNKNLPVDAWENSPLLGIENNSVSIKRILEAQPEIFTAQTIAGLSLYAQKLSRQKS